MTSTAPTPPRRGRPFTPLPPSMAQSQPEAPDRVILGFGAAALVLAAMGAAMPSLGRAHAVTPVLSVALALLSVPLAVVTCALGLRRLVRHHTPAYLRLIVGANLLITLAGAAVAYGLWQIVVFVAWLIWDLTHPSVWCC